jgi:hypothetical protein
MLHSPLLSSSRQESGREECCRKKYEPDRARYPKELICFGTRNKTQLIQTVVWRTLCSFQVQRANIRFRWSLSLIESSLRRQQQATLNSSREIIKPVQAGTRSRDCGTITRKIPRTVHSSSATQVAAFSPPNLPAQVIPAGAVKTLPLFNPSWL